MKVVMAPVPAPKEVPVHQIAETLGLLAGLRAEKGDGGWRCSHCRAYQKDQAWTVWVPDGVRATDSAEAISDQCRRSCLNGHSSGWCLACAKNLGKPARTIVRSLLRLFRSR